MHYKQVKALAILMSVMMGTTPVLADSEITPAPTLQAMESTGEQAENAHEGNDDSSDDSRDESAENSTPSQDPTDDSESEPAETPDPDNSEGEASGNGEGEDSTADDSEDKNDPADTDHSENSESEDADDGESDGYDHHDTENDSEDAAGKESNIPTSESEKVDPDIPDKTEDQSVAGESTPDKEKAKSKENTNKNTNPTSKTKDAAAKSKDAAAATPAATPIPTAIPDAAATQIPTPTPEDEEDLKPYSPEINPVETVPITQGTNALSVLIRRGKPFELTDKVYAVTYKDINIYEGKGENHDIVGTAKADTILYVLSNNGTWVYIESGEVRGYVHRYDVYIGDMADEIVEKEGESGMRLATVVKAPAENEAFFKSNSTTNEKLTQLNFPTSMVTRIAMIEYAKKYLGRPYVWGGTDLWNGCDCSGFAGGVYREYGYDLPRVSRDQAKCGIQIDPHDAQIGDLLFYTNANGVVCHVMIYLGDSYVIHARGRAYGIVINEINLDSVCWACRIIDDERSIDGELPNKTGDARIDDKIYTDEELDHLYRELIALGAEDYDDVITMLSVAMNRADMNLKRLGTNAMVQLDDMYEYLHTNEKADDIDDKAKVSNEIKQAVADCLEGGVRTSTETAISAIISD